VRCFVAIELPPAASAALVAAGSAVRKLDPSWAGEKWVAPESLHVTLKFLGEVDAGQVDVLGAALADLARVQAPFEVALRSLRAVPGGRRTSMIWAAVDDPSGSCASLAARIDTSAEQIGVERDVRRFSPHITLVRARHPRSLAPDVLPGAAEASGLAQLHPVSVGAVTLFQSTLTRTGPIHEPLGAFSFQAP
jgi:RNA 2',3'-cyclic 3'-phosphodiesterase